MRFKKMLTGISTEIIGDRVKKILFASVSEKDRNIGEVIAVETKSLATAKQFKTIDSDVIVYVPEKQQQFVFTPVVIRPMEVHFKIKKIIKIEV